MIAMLAGISVTCFAASYAVALALEVSRLFFRSGLRGALMLGFAAAGLFAHTLFLGYRATIGSASPLSSNFDWCLLAAWLLAAAYLYGTYLYPRAGLGLIMLPLVLGFVGAATLLASRESIAPESASRAWGTVHGIFLLLGDVLVMIGFAAGVMYLFQLERLRRKLPPTPRLKMPSLEVLERINARMLPVSTMLVAVGFIAGIILKVTGERRFVELPWTDPVVWTSGGMLVWLLAASAFEASYRPARQGRKVAYLTIASFGFLLATLGAFLLVETKHGQPEARRLAPSAGVEGASP